MTTDERSLLEQLLDEVFAFQIKHVEPLEPLEPHPATAYLPPLNARSAGSESLLALNDVLARGYSQRCETEEHQNDPDTPFRQPHGHSPRGW